MATSGNGTTAGVGSPCGACKFLRRKCASDCIFAPYFSSEQGAARFAAIHKVFGASNVSKLLLNVPIHDRYEAVVTIAYEAQARLHDPVYGCVSHIFALQQQVAYLQAQVMQMKVQIGGHQTSAAGDLRNSSESTHQFMTWQQSSGSPIGSAYAIPYDHHHHPCYGHVNPNNPILQQSSPEESLSSTSSDVTTTANLRETHQTGAGVYGHGGLGFHEGYPSKKRPVSYCNSDLGELQALALRMMKN
ncbi:LOB domain-containing protein 16 [Raphanus sativus]|uniref:LOB domain-containing protein 16 n=1 Tax=Raphanus sativus TaxID=3726 RepID=A0A6J0JRD7_RAPSA|nr:LOB domain-containing protein 16 [Raphanus sativus]KAJ4892165.1 LOB domain-containing protein 16 [Raphanus sativus]